MNTIEQVEALLQQLIAEGQRKPDIVAQVAEACMGWPYVFGAWGEQCTPANRRRRVSDAHPTIKSKCPALNNQTCDECKWGCGVRMFDCRGFTAWLIRSVGLSMTGEGATQQYNTNSNWMRKGTINEMPDVVCCVFKKSGNTMEHTGMHVGGGRIIHCSVNVQEGSTSDKGWTHYAIPAGLYKDQDLPVVHPTLRKGNSGEQVRELQELLNSLGYDCGVADGIFGTKTQNAVISFQKAHGLTADGVVGPKTWAALLGPATTYRVVIQHVTDGQYAQILKICPNAERYEESGD